MLLRERCTSLHLAALRAHSWRQGDGRSWMGGLGSRGDRSMPREVCALPWWRAAGLRITAMAEWGTCATGRVQLQLGAWQHGRMYEAIRPLGGHGSASLPHDLLLI